MNYITTRAIEPIQNTYRTSHYTQRYITLRPKGYTNQFLPRYERTPTVRTMKASHFFDRIEQQALRRLARKKTPKDSYLSLTAATEVFTKNKYRENKDDWVRFFEPIVIYSNHHKAIKIKKSKKVGFELIELKTDGTCYEFLIRKTTINRFVEWEDLRDVNIVREYLKTHDFPDDQCYSKKAFLDEVENVGGYILLCVERRRTAKFILNLCRELIGAST